MIIRIPWGIAAEPLLPYPIDSDGALVTPTLASGDVTISKDDGSGFDNVDAAVDSMTTSDGLRIPISIVEASPPTALNGQRLLRIVDQPEGTAFLSEQHVIQFTDHPLAFDPNGCIYGGTLDAVTDVHTSGTTMILPATPETWEAPAASDVINGWYSHIWNDQDVHGSAYVDDYDSSTRVVTFVTNQGLNVNLQDSATTVYYRLYPDKPWDTPHSLLATAANLATVDTNVDTLVTGVNVSKVNDVTITGDGAATPFQPA